MSYEVTNVEYCEECGFPMSYCGDPNPDGEPSLDCKVCQLKLKLDQARRALYFRAIEICGSLAFVEMHREVLAERDADRDRLDLLEKAAQNYRDTYGLIYTEAPAQTPDWKYYCGGHRGPTLRAAIDAAINSTQP